MAAWDNMNFQVARIVLPTIRRFSVYIPGMLSHAKERYFTGVWVRRISTDRDHVDRGDIFRNVFQTCRNETEQAEFH